MLQDCFFITFDVFINIRETMKRKNKIKINLQKIKITKLNNSMKYNVRGGGFQEIDKTIHNLCNSDGCDSIVPCESKGLLI